MSVSPSQRGYRSVAGAAVALLALVCLAPARAEAGCAHYVVSGKSNGWALLSRLDVLNPIGSQSTTVTAEPPVRPKPCSGALCSGKPAVPVPAPVVSVETRAEHWGELLSPPTSPALEGRLLVCAESLLRPILEGPSIDHPPRASVSSLS